MIISIIKKILAAISSLLVISVSMFLLSKMVPGDPVEVALGMDPSSATQMDYEQEYERKKKDLSLHLPYFYFSVLPSNFPKNLQEKGTLSELRERRHKLMKEAKLLPKVHWHGTKNQYHNWIWGDNVSVLDGKAASYKIGRALVWTMFLVILSVSLSYGLGILIGLMLSSMRSVRLRAVFEAWLFGVYAIPVFWMATLLLVFFTTKEYGAWTNIFPAVGLVPIDYGEAWYSRIGKFGSQLILPCFVLVLHNLAFLSMLTKRNLDKHRKLAFTKTSKAYGFKQSEILIKEVLPMSLLPLITSLSSAIPTAIGGSLIVEIIFNIPGMGRLLFTSVLNYDWPVVFPIVLLIACITYITYLLADVFYKIADPRIQ